MASAPAVSFSPPAAEYLAPVFAQYPLEVASAQGVWLTNSRGERVLDLYGGHAVAALGYGHPAWTAALARQDSSASSSRTPSPWRYGRVRPSAS